MDTIGQIVARIRVEEAYSSASELQLLMYCVDSYKQMLRNNFYIKKTVYLQVNPLTQSVDLPDDYLSYSKLAVCVNKEIAVLSFDPSICSVPDKVCACDTPTPDPTPTEDSCNCSYCGGYYGFNFLNFQGNYISDYYNPAYGKLYGAADLRNRYGRFNILDGKIVFGGNFQYDYAIMEYAALDQSLTQDTEIDQWCVLPLGYRVREMYEMSLKRPDYNKIAYYKGEYQRLEADNIILRHNWDLSSLTKTAYLRFGLMRT